MKRLTLHFLAIVTILIVPEISQGQHMGSVDSLEKEIQKINREITHLKDSISSNKNLVKILKDSIKTIQIEKSDSAWINIFKTKVYKMPDNRSERLDILYKGAPVNVIDTTNNFYKVVFLGTGLFGYGGDLIEGYMNIQEQLLSRKEIEKLTYKEIIIGDGGTFNERQKRIPEKTKRAIENGEVFIGMKRKWVIESWGLPDEINKTKNQYGVREQFIYDSSYRKRKYLYIENGVLTTIQE